MAFPNNARRGAMSEIEAAGDLITGGLVAGAIERESRARASGEAHSAICLNCGTSLLGSHCHRCGQPEHIHRSLGAIWHDISHGVLHFEGKIWKTLPLLAWRPGDLTRRYIHGERARFVSPMALFLFSVFLMFAVMGALGIHFNPAGGEGSPIAPREQAEIEAKVKRDVAALDAQIAAAKARGLPTADLERERNTAASIGGLVANAEVEGPQGTINTTIPFIDNPAKKALKNPALLFYKIQTSAYKFSWALIPISTPLLWLLFAWRRQYRFYDHAVFVTYSLAFMSLLTVVLTLLSAVPGIPAPLLISAATFIPPLHMYRQMRGAYSLSRRNALVRTFALLWMALFAMIMFVLLLITLGAFG